MSSYIVMRISTYIYIWWTVNSFKGISSNGDQVIKTSEPEDKSYCNISIFYPQTTK